MIYWLGFGPKENCFVTQTCQPQNWKGKKVLTDNSTT